MNTRLQEKLREQLDFLRRSCRDFDSGAETEALRMATTIRVLFHDTSRSHSLLEQLRLKRGKMLSSARGFGDWQDYLKQQIDVSSKTPMKMLPMLGNNFRELSAHEWWGRESVFIHGGRRYSRRLIILSAANKDGGAHVDPRLDRYYEILAAGEYAISITANLTFEGAPWFEQGVPHYAKNAHLTLIRQFAHEALASATQYRWV